MTCELVLLFAAMAVCCAPTTLAASSLRPSTTKADVTEAGGEQL